jgi:hypothetical protein
MEYRKISENEIAERMQIETAHIKLSEKRKIAIIHALEKKNNPVSRFMEREIRIPLKTLIAGCAIVIVLATTVFYPLLRVSEKDLQENKIIIYFGEGRL